jgi:patatin-related protein
VWIEKADISALKADPPTTSVLFRTIVWLASRVGPIANLRRKVDELPGLSWSWLRDTVYTLFTTKDGRVTPLDGRYFARMIASTFKDMATAGGDVALLPHRGTFDLFLTRTDLHGWPRHLPVSCEFHPTALFERTHGHVMAFHKGPIGGNPIDEFDLTFATRTTAGFPGAFAPVSFDDVAADFHDARPGDNPPPLDEFARRHLREHALAAFPVGRTWMIDGGVLDNKPFSHVARAIEDKPADHQVYRIVIYIEPDPETMIDKPPEKVPLPLKVLKGLYALFRHEPIYDDLRHLQDRNARVERIREIRGANLSNARRAAQAVGTASGLEWPPQTADLGRWRELTNVEAAREPLSGYAGYVMIKAHRAAEVAAEVICGALDYPYHSRHGYLMRNLVRAWLMREGALRPPAYIEGEGHRLSAAQLALLGALDVPFRIRRVRALVQAVNEAYSRLPEDPDERRASRSQLDACKEALADIAFAYEAALGEVDEVREQIRGMLGGVGTDEIDRIIEDLQFDATATIDRFASDLHAVYETLLRRFTITGDEQNRCIAEATDRLPAWARDEVTSTLATFPFVDLLVFPLMDGVGITDLITVASMRVSPQDAVFLSQDPKRLKSRELGAFAGFLDRGAREHDLMWGRLDGVERLVELIVTAAASAEEKGTALEGIRRDFTRRAMQAVLDEEAVRLDSRISDTAHQLQEKLAAIT